MNRREIVQLYAPVKPTSHPRVLVGWNGPRKGMDWVLLFEDDGGDWDRSGVVYPTLVEAAASIPARAAEYFGTKRPALRFLVGNLSDAGPQQGQQAMTLTEIAHHFEQGGKPVVIYGPAE